METGKENNKFKEIKISFEYIKKCATIQDLIQLNEEVLK